MITRPAEKLRRRITWIGKKLIHFFGTVFVRPLLTRGAHFPPEDSTEPRILYINLAYRGDLILSFPAISAIRMKYPACRITCWVRGYNLSLARINPDISDVISYDSFRSGGHAVFWELVRFRRHRALISALRERRFDLMIDDSGTGFTAVSGAVARIPLRIGRDTQGYGFLYHAEFPYDENGHLINKKIRILRTLGIEEAQSHGVRLPVDESTFRAVACKLGIDTELKFFTVQPYAGWEAKNWQMGKFVAVVNGFVKVSGLRPIFLGGPADIGRIDEIRRGISGDSFSTAGVLELSEVFALISRAQMHFGVDSVAAHMAAMAGIRSATLFGPTNPRLIAHLSTDNIALLREISCSPAQDRLYCALDAGRLCPRYLCMESLDADKVIGVLTEHWKGLIREQIVYL
jgi:heptosyltransferase II